MRNLTNLIQAFILNEEIAGIVGADEKGGMTMESEAFPTHVCLLTHMYGPGIPRMPGHNSPASIVGPDLKRRS